MKRSMRNENIQSLGISLDPTELLQIKQFTMELALAIASDDELVANHVVLLERVLAFAQCEAAHLFCRTRDRMFAALSTPSSAGALSRLADPETVPWLTQAVLSGETFYFSSLDELPSAAIDDRRVLCESGVVSFFLQPLVFKGSVVGALAFSSSRPKGITERQQIFGEEVAPALAAAIYRNQITSPRLEALKQLVSGDIESVFFSVIDSLHEAISCCDREGRVVYANPSMQRITGYSWEEILGKRVYEFFFPEESKAFQEARTQQHERYTARLRGVPEEYETQVTRKDGQRQWLQVKASPMRDGATNIVGSIGIVSDITEKRSLEEQLRWSQKMEAVGRLAGSIAHDFNNLLTVIVGYAEMLLLQVSTEDPAYRKLLSIKEAGDTASALTRQLLSVSKRQVMQPELADLSSVVEETLGIVEDFAGQTVAVSIDLERGMPPVRVDSSQIQQVLINLVINARDAMPRGGELFIKTRRCSESFDSRHRYLELRVSDTGTGIADDVMGRLFEPFFTTKNEGTGLGLSTTFTIVEQHGGKITVKSDVGRGASFSVFLPEAAGEAPRTVQAGLQEKEEPGTDAKRILVVEDENHVREFVCDALRGSGFSVTEAGDGQEALDVIEKWGADVFDIVLTDLAMPRVDGFALAERLLKDHPKLKVMMMSGCTHNSALPKHIVQRGIPFLAKPFSPNTLVRKLKSL